MANQTRRNFLKKSVILGASLSAVGARDVKAEPGNILSEDRMGVLVDTTVCVGCLSCEWACKTAHNIPAEDIEKFHDRSKLKKFRRPEPDSFTVVNEFDNPKNPLLPIHVKVQCMHCDRPGCVSACIVGAISKNENGAVTWDTDKCIGCRYCMVACPFQIPTFDFFTPLDPKIRKCDFCISRTKDGKLPACVEICPTEVMTFAPRSELIRIARQRIKRRPGVYLDHIFGETEVGGTSWMYLASKNFDGLGFPKLGKNPAPGISEAIQHGIFAYFVPPIALYSLLGGLMWLNKKRQIIEEEGEND